MIITNRIPNELRSQCMVLISLERLYLMKKSKNIQKSIVNW
ncbi:hypothetical protein KP78_20050 [Jeotgalibacillus soli]|uniref:Uncharacterized protein n=1 Tax=Jeotgalibacillus soli TaxID=889306 RepID=A0A0C2VMJ1_9BACL|nr:hypothetical protein KP78_20050 [Jeotgalibacillus soli]